MKLTAVLLIGATLSASPLTWMRRHPKIITAIAGSVAASASMRHTKNQAVTPVPDLHAITCGICRGLGR